jgi:hypothetical protein
LGVLFRGGHTWDELARAIQGSSEDPEFLLSIINDISIYGTKSKHVFKAIQTIKDWSSYTADKNQLPFKIAEGGKILRSPDRKQGLADVTRETLNNTAKLLFEPQESFDPLGLNTNRLKALSVFVASIVLSLALAESVSPSGFRWS